MGFNSGFKGLIATFKAYYFHTGHEIRRFRICLWK